MKAGILIPVDPKCPYCRSHVDMVSRMMKLRGEVLEVLTGLRGEQSPHSAASGVLKDAIRRVKALDDR